MAAKKKKKAVGRKKAAVGRAPSPPPAPRPDDDDDDFEDDDDDFEDENEDDDLEDEGVSGDTEEEDEDEDEVPVPAPSPRARVPAPKSMSKDAKKALLKEWFELQKEIDDFEAKRVKIDGRKSDIARELAASGLKQVKFRGSVLTITAGGKKRGPSIRRKSLNEDIEDLS